MTRYFFRLAAAACIAPLLSACGAGGRSVPVAVAQTPIQGAAFGIPQTAARGVLVTVYLPLRNAAELEALVARQSDRSSPDYHRFITPDQFRATYGPSAADLSTVATSLRALGFDAHRTSQAIVAAAPQAVVERTFGVRLHAAAARGRVTAGAARSALSADRAPTLPAALARLGAAVSFSPYVRRVHSLRVSVRSASPANRFSEKGPYWFTDLKQAYGYPAYQTANGAGRTIAVVIDSEIRDGDLGQYFGAELLAPPLVQRRPVDGGPPGFTLQSDSSFEASLDVQQAFGSAPGAKIVLYGVPDLSDQSVFDAYSAIVDENKADIVNSSFGLCELFYTAAYNGGSDLTPTLRLFHDVFLQGNAQGISFVTSSGDNGAFGCLDPGFTRFIRGVENPADDPAVTAVGGTNLVTKTEPGSLASPYLRESAYFDRLSRDLGALPDEIFGSGGGVSVIFGKPWYQNLVATHAAARTVPDLAMHMGGCPVGSLAPCTPDASSVLVAADNQFFLLIGTSAAAPEFAGLLAVTEETLGTRLGNANGYIYGLAARDGAVYRQNIPGDNGYRATPGYNYVLGNGTPHAAAFALQLGAPLAGNPQTPSNP